MTQVAFISGHLDVTELEFAQHYVPKIEMAMKVGHHFVIGDARGTDNFAANLLMRVFSEEPSRVTIYHMWNAPRFSTQFPLSGGYRSDDARDEAMTIASDYDIAWVRPGRERSGTANNLWRRSSYQADMHEIMLRHNLDGESLSELKKIRFALNMEIARCERRTPPKAKK